MKRRIMAVFLALSMLLLTGCSEPAAIPEKVQSVISTITEKIEPEPQEFYEIDIPNGWTVFNADMFDERTVILLLGNSIFGEYQIAYYHIGSGLSTGYKGNFRIEFDEIDYFATITLSVDPYVVADTAHQVVYRFSDDMLDVTEVSTYDLNTHSYEYCSLRDSLLYTVNTESACQLREYSFATSEDSLLMDFGKSYTFIDISNYYEATDTAVLSGSELFTYEGANILFDLSDNSVIGQFDSSYTSHNSSSGKVAMSWFSETGSDFFVTMVDTEQQTVAPVYSIDMTNSVFDIRTDEYVYVFSAGDGSQCNIDAYNIDTGVLSYSGSFDYADFANVPVPVDHNEEEPISVYLSSSEKYSYLDGTLLFGIHADNDYYYDSLIIWDTSLAESKQEPLTAADAIDYPVYEVHEHEYSDSNTAYADAIEADYGVNIYYGDDADQEFNDYNAELVYDENAIFRGLAALEEALSMFPDGFFAEFSDSDYLRGINFYLCGKISPIGEDTISDPAAFTYTDSGYAMVVANVYEDHALVSHFCHELSHVIDNRLIAEGHLDEEVWNSFNPDGFEYNYSYTGEDGEDYLTAVNDEYTINDENYYIYGDIECIYFIDSYAKTYPTEDRARIIEYSMVEDHYSYEFFESSHLQAKLEYLSQCIRECWDSSDWVGKTVWEQFLGDSDV